MLSTSMLERLGMHRLASGSGTARLLCEYHAYQASHDLCVGRCWLKRKGPCCGLKTSTSALAPIDCRSWARRSIGTQRACTGHGCQQPSQAASCDSLCKALGRAGRPQPSQPALGAPALPDTGIVHFAPALLGTAETGAAAALAALLLFSAPAAAAESGVAYDPGAGGDLLKNVAGVAYLLLVAVFLARLLRRRTNSSLSQVRVVAAVLAVIQVMRLALLPARPVYVHVGREPANWYAGVSW